MLYLDINISISVGQCSVKCCSLFIVDIFCLPTLCFGLQLLIVMLNRSFLLKGFGSELCFSVWRVS